MNQRNSYIERKYDKVFSRGYLKKLIEKTREINRVSYIRVNLSKKSSSDVETFLKKNRVKFSKNFLPNSFRIEKSFFSLSSSYSNLFGNFYIQDLASQVPVNLIDFKSLKKLNREVKILDMAASPGSKTSQLCDLLKFHDISYSIIALEPNEKRITKLVNNLQKQECSNVEIKKCKAEEFKSELMFDLILADVPCSGNVVGDKNWLSKRDANGILSNSSLQKKILKNAYNLLNENGVLVYSTCSLEVEENEENVDFCVKKLGLKTIKSDFKFGFDISPLRGFSKGVENSIRFDPLKSSTQGFFVCLMRK